MNTSQNQSELSLLEVAKELQKDFIDGFEYNGTTLATSGLASKIDEYLKVTYGTDSFTSAQRSELAKAVDGLGRFLFFWAFKGVSIHRQP